ncbi:conserved hypothetical protein [Sphingomonas sp. 8AM]|nr:conserved hypothetical protein [Sphingomonas sp. 8AM]
MPLPWKPSTRAAAINRPSSTSSPDPSTARPQRASRAMSTIGAKVQSIPDADASTAAARAVRRASSGSKLAASASGTGKTVRSPWMTSAANSSGIFSRERRTASVCIRRAISAPLPLNTPVSSPRRTIFSCASKLDAAPAGLSEIAAPPAQAAASRLSCPAFSVSVIRGISASTEAGRGRAATVASKARAGLADHASAAPAPASHARRVIRRSCPFILLPFPLRPRVIHAVRPRHLHPSPRP